MTHKPNLNLLVLIISIFALASAYVAEYVFELAACPLCVYQRFPYVILIALAIIGIAAECDYRKYYLAIFTASAALAFYHFGIENGWFKLSAICKPAVMISDDASAADFKKAISSNDAVPCDKVAASFLGLSMAVWNLIVNVMMIGATLAWRKNA